MLVQRIRQSVPALVCLVCLCFPTIVPGQTTSLPQSAMYKSAAAWLKDLHLPLSPQQLQQLASLWEVQQLQSSHLSTQPYLPHYDTRRIFSTHFSSASDPAPPVVNAEQKLTPTAAYTSGSVVERAAYSILNRLQQRPPQKPLPQPQQPLSVLQPLPAHLAAALHAFLQHVLQRLAASGLLQPCNHTVNEPAYFTAEALEHSSTQHRAVRTHNQESAWYRSDPAGPSSGSSTSSRLSPRATAMPATAQRYAFAANFHNSALVLPSMLQQLIRLLLQLQPGSAYVSIWESGSNDGNITASSLIGSHGKNRRSSGVGGSVVSAASGSSSSSGGSGHSSNDDNSAEAETNGGSNRNSGRRHLASSTTDAPVEGGASVFIDSTVHYLHLLRALLALLGVQHSVMTSGSILVSKGHDRIGFLATARNKALQPILEASDSGGFTADRIVFINDVFMCAGDVMRLMQHGAADVACGMDFWTAAPRPVAKLNKAERAAKRKRLAQEKQQHQIRLQEAQEEHAQLQHHEAHSQHAETSAAAVATAASAGQHAASRDSASAAEGASLDMDSISAAAVPDNVAGVEVQFVHLSEHQHQQLPTQSAVAAIPDKRVAVPATPSALQDAHFDARVGATKLGTNVAISSDLGSPSNNHTLLRPAAGSSNGSNNEVTPDRLGSEQVQEQPIFVTQGAHMQAGQKVQVSKSDESQRQHGRRLQHQQGLDPFYVSDDMRLKFYDSWVARDIAGGRIGNHPPYSGDLDTATALREGLPTAMQCCWNGLVVLRAEPFLQRRMRFRSHAPGECAASECSLMCNDLHRAGYGKVVMDPGVRVAYTYNQTQRLYTGQARGLKVLPWSKVMAHASVLARAWPAVNTSNVECCDLRAGKMAVNFKVDCHPVDIMSLPVP